MCNTCTCMCNTFVQYRKIYRFYTIICLSLDNTRVSQQMPFIFGQSVHQLSQDILKMLQDFAIAEIQW